MKLKGIVVLLTLVLVCSLACSQNKNNANKETNTKETSAKESVLKAPVDVTVITMKGNQFGGVDAGLNQGLENFLGTSLNITTVDREDALKDPKYQGFNLDYMPLYLIHRTDAVNEKFKEPIEKGYLKATDNFIVMEKQTRYGVFADKKAIPNQLELFVMSQCPYGVMAENKIIEAKKAGLIADNIKVKVRYIVSQGRTADTFNSLHGTAEWEEDVRQAIIQSKYPSKFWKYLEEFNKDYRTTRWDAVAQKAGIDPTIFRTQWKEGLRLVREDMKSTREYNISGSPSFVWEGRVVTDMGGLSSIPGLEGINQVPASNGASQQMPQGRC